MSDDEENKRPAVAEPDAQDAVAMPPVPSEGTTAALAYVTAVNADLRFFDFIIRTTLNQDYMRYVAKQTLDGKTPHHNDPTHLATTAPGPSVRFLRENSQALLEMFVARLVDNFQKYLVDAIREILRSKPAMLSTTKQSITLEELLK
jgi:hypothetical protein